ncbi:MAG: hypothetical protein IKX75_04295 [Desulfovibrio sp.]|nr:hypothetical protein [Desulfovibrio sp.]
MGIPLLWEKVLELSATVEEGVQIICGTAPLRDGVFRKLRNAGFKVLEIFGSSETGVLCTRTEAESPFALMPHFSRLTRGDGGSLVERRLPLGGTKLFPLQDRFSWQGDRLLVPEGRADRAVQVGGVNVFPDKVAQCLRGHPEVAECTVRLMRPEEGTRLKAFVVLKRGLQPDMAVRRSLRGFVKSRLESAEQPVRFDFGEELPRNSMGKLADW